MRWYSATRARLVEFMRGNGIIRLVDEHTLVDHIGLVLHLMVRIADNRPEVLCEYVAEHVPTWSPCFLERLALLTRAMLAGMGKALAVDVEYPRYVR